MRRVEHYTVKRNWKPFIYGFFAGGFIWTMLFVVFVVV